MINSYIPTYALKLLDFLLHLIHLSIIGFFIFGWLIESTRIAHFILSLLILISWCGLGIFFGFGYCLVTDIQWKIKKRLNQIPTTEFYIKYILDKMSGLNINPNIINGITTFAFFGIFIISISFILIDFFRN